MGAVGASGVIEGAPPSQAPSGGWRGATVTEVGRPAPTAVRLRLDVPDRVTHLPGQHYVVRLTAPDGYVAQRSYSVASAPADPQIELYVERLADGEVSPFLADEVRVGDRLMVRGPIGGWFVWDGTVPVLGVGGGTGVVPLVAMARHASDLGHPDLVRLAVSAKSLERLPYADELLARGATVALSRQDGPDRRPRGRLRAADLRPLVAGRSTYYVCGSAPFAESLSALLVEMGAPTERVRVERFGPSG